MSRVISNKLHKDLITDLKLILNNTKDAGAIETIKDRIDRLEASPEYRTGQNYEWLISMGTLQKLELDDITTLSVNFSTQYNLLRWINKNCKDPKNISFDTAINLLIENCN